MAGGKTGSITPLIIGAIAGGILTAAILHARGDSVGWDESASAPTAGRDGSLRSDIEAISSSLPDAAAAPDLLSPLAGIQSPAELRAAAIELLDSFVKTRDGIAAIAAALPAADRMNFTFDAIAGIAAEDPANAIRLALSLDDFPARSEAIRRVAQVMGSLDPQQAMRFTDTIGNYDLIDVFRSAVLQEWSGNDPGGFLAFVASADPAEIRVAGDAFAIAAATQPESLLAMLDRIPQSARLTAERAALEGLVVTDLRAALAHLESLPLGNARETLYRTTAERYAEIDLEGALAWAESLEPPSAQAVNGVLWVLAKTDPLRGAADLVARVQAVGGTSAGFDANLVLQAFTPGPPELLSAIAERLSGADSAAVKTIFDSFMADWAQDDPVAAYEWARINPDRLTSSAVFIVARQLTSARPELAMQAADRFGPNTQSLWVRAVAAELGRGNLDSALQWIARYQGQPVYEEALGGVLESATLMGDIRDPVALAQFLDQQSPEARANSIAVVANVWAERDPVAAAAWVERASLSGAGEERRRAAILNVASRWASRDADAAGRWAMSLAEGETRDFAIGNVLTIASENGTVDTRLIDAMSTDSARQRVLTGRIMQNLGRIDPDFGRQLIGQYVTDPAIRAQAEERLVEGMSGLGTPSGNVVQLR